MAENLSTTNTGGRILEGLGKTAKISGIKFGFTKPSPTFYHTHLTQHRTNFPLTKHYLFKPAFLPETTSITIKMMLSNRENRIFAFDGRTERVLSNTYNCIITNLIKKDSTEARQVLVVDARCRISFKIDEYRSHFEISILVPRGTDGEKFYTSYLRLDARCSTEYAIQVVGNNVYKALCGDEEKVLDHNICYQLSMRYDHHKLCAENIFSDSCPIYVADLRDHLRTSTHIAFFIRASEQVQTDFDNLKAQLEADLEKNPVLKWYPANVRRPVIQKGMYLKAAERPQIEAVPGVYTYFDWPDYMTKHGYGHIYNQEYIENILDPFAAARHEMFFFSLPGGADRRVMFFLRLSTEDNELRLLPDDKLHVFFDEEQDITKAWNATIMNPLPYSPLSTVTGYLTRPWDKEEKRYKDTTSLHAVPWSSLHSPANGMSRILQQPHWVSLRLKTSDKPFSRTISALEHLNRAFANLISATPRQREDLKYLLGNHYDTVRKVDIYESVIAKQPEPHSIMELNEGQLEAVMKARSLPAGWFVIHGPPGTGKTYLIAEMLKPFFVDEEHHRILVCSANNTGVDNTARRCQEVLTKLQNEGKTDAKKYVIRLHSLDTEKEVVEKDAKLNRPVPEDSRPKCVQEFGEEEREILERLDMAKLIVDEYERATNTGFDGVHDKRVVEIEMSLGYRMLQVAGLIREKDGKLFPWAQPNLRSVTNFVESYRMYNDGEEMDRQRSITFKAQTKQLSHLVMDGAAALFCTLATAATPPVAFAYGDAEGVAIDEAAKVMECDIWPIMQHYESLAWKLLVGDPDQLGPVVQSDPRSNPFFHVIKRSLMLRLLCTGATYHLLTEQSRAIPELAEPYNHVVYDDLLTHAPATNPKLRPIASAIRTFNLKHYNRNSNIIYIDLWNGEAEITATGSVYNNKSCQLGLNLLERLIAEVGEVRDEEGNPCNFAILTAYQAQYRCYQSGVQKMSKPYPQVLRVVDVDKIDRRQGSEWHVVIVDLTRTDGAGFLRERSRLNVLFSRAKNGMFIIANKRCIDALQISKGKFLQKFQSQYLRTLIHREELGDCRWYQPGQVNVEDTVGLDPERYLDDIDDRDKIEIDSFAAASITAPPSKVLPMVNSLLLNQIRSWLVLTPNWDLTGTAISHSRAYHVDDLEHFLEDFVSPRTMFRDVYPKAYAQPTPEVREEITGWLKTVRYYYTLNSLSKEFPYETPSDTTDENPRVDWVTESCAADYDDYLDILPYLDHFQAYGPKETGWRKDTPDEKESDEKEQVSGLDQGEQTEEQIEGGWGACETDGGWGACEPVDNLGEWE